MYFLEAQGKQSDIYIYIYIYLQDSDFQF